MTASGSTAAPAALDEAPPPEPVQREVRHVPRLLNREPLPARGDWVVQVLVRQPPGVRPGPEVEKRPPAEDDK